jgi:hypothetical protein
MPKKNNNPKKILLTIPNSLKFELDAELSFFKTYKDSHDLILDAIQQYLKQIRLHRLIYNYGTDIMDCKIKNNKKNV